MPPWSVAVRAQSKRRAPYLAGERFIRDAAFGAGHLQQAVIDLKLVQRGLTGELRVGVMASLATGFLADLFSSFRASFTDVEVKLEEASSQANAAGVLNGRLDAAFISGTPQLPGCDARKLCVIRPAKFECRLTRNCPDHNRTDEHAAGRTH